MRFEFTQLMFEKKSVFFIARLLVNMANRSVVLRASLSKESLELLQQLVGEQIKIKSTHKCRQCGFATHSLFWQCPSCRQWGSIKPIRGLDGE